MTHAFKVKKSSFKTTFSKKLDIKKLAIRDKNDVKNALETALFHLKMEDDFKLENCSFNFIFNEIFFTFGQPETKTKDEFFESVKKFDNFLTV